MEDIVLVGFGGHGKSVADCIERQGNYRIVGYTDLHSCCDGKYAYLGTDAVLNEIYQKGVHNAVVCIGFLGKGSIRKSMYEKLKCIGYDLPIIVDPSAVVSERAEIGEGTFIGKSAVVNSEARIGKMVIINTKALVEHECVVGDFSHIAVSTVLCGNVSVGESSFIGANVTVIQSLNLGTHVVVGAGTVVTKNMDSGMLLRNVVNTVLMDNRIYSKEENNL